MEFSFWQFFYDPVLRAPTLGTVLMGIVSALMGVIVFVRRNSLIGETIAHSAYPGLIGSVLFITVFGANSSLGFLLGASVSAFLGLYVVEKLRKRYRIHPDAALCLVLALFLGVGVVFASRLQFVHPVLYKQTQTFLYGQAATMSDLYILVYGAFLALVVLFIVVKFSELETHLFDHTFAETVKGRRKGMDTVLFVLLVFSLVLGIRSVGVVLMSGMLIAPAAAARQWTHRFSTLFVLSALFGALSGFYGNYLSVRIPEWVGGERSFSLPTGPMILLVAAGITLLSLLFAPDRGAISRLIRISRFRFRCTAENVLKTIWKGGECQCLTKKEMKLRHPISTIILNLVLITLGQQGWIKKVNGTYHLTDDGKRRGAHLVRLHRLWELYLTTCLKAGEKRVHCSAEEMEHIITPDLERKLSLLLRDPKKDPHKQPIPNIEDTLCIQ